MRLKKLLCVLLALTMAASLLLAPAAAYADTEGHWAAGAIERWSGEGVVQGADGRFRPDAPITRAELAVILDRLMAYRTESGASYADVVPGAWYEGAVRRAAAAGVMQGDGAGMRPLDPITRQEAAVLLGRALGVAEDAGAADSYSDAADIAAWARGYLGGLTAAGILQGSGGRANPTAPITRAEVVTILDNALAARYVSAGEYSADAAGDAIVSAPGVTLRDMAVQGRLIIAEGVGDGAVILDSVRVGEAVVVRGGGIHSVVIKGNSSIPAITVERRDGAVRVAVEGAAAVEAVYVNDGSDGVRIEGRVDTVSVSGAGAKLEVTGDVGEIRVLESAAGAALTVAEGAKVGSVTAAAPKAQVDIAGTVDKVETTSTAAGSAVTAEKTAVVKEVVAGAEGTTVSGAGKVDKVTATGDGVAVTTPGTRVEAAAGTTGVTAGGTEIKGGETAEVKPSTPSGGGGGGGGSTPAAITGLDLRCVNTRADYDALPVYVRTGDTGLAWDEAQAPYLIALFNLNVKPPVDWELSWRDPAEADEEFMMKPLGHGTLTEEDFGQTGTGARYLTLAFGENDPTVGFFHLFLAAGGEKFETVFVRDASTLDEVLGWWELGGYRTALGADATLTESFEVPEGKSLVIPEGVTLTVPEGKTFTVGGWGELTVYGALKGSGEIVNHGIIFLEAQGGLGATTNETLDGFDAAQVWQHAAWTGSAWALGDKPDVTNVEFGDGADEGRQPVLTAAYWTEHGGQLVPAADSARAAVTGGGYGRAVIEVPVSMTLPAGQTLALLPNVDLNVKTDTGTPTVLTVAGTLRGNPADPPEDGSDYNTSGFNMGENSEIVITGSALYTWGWMDNGALTVQGETTDLTVTLCGGKPSLTVDGAVLNGGINLTEGAQFSAVAFRNGGTHQGPILEDDNWEEPIGRDGEIFLTSLAEVEAFWAAHPGGEARLGRNVELTEDFTIPADCALVLELPGALTVHEGATLTVAGVLVNNNGVMNFGTIAVTGDGLLLNHDTVWNYGSITGKVSIEREGDAWPEFYQYAALEHDGTAGWKLDALPQITMAEDNGSVIAAVRVDWDDPNGVYAQRSTDFLKEVFKDDDSRGVYTNANVEVRGDWENEIPVTMTIPEGMDLKLPGYMTLAIINSYTTLDVKGAITALAGDDAGCVRLIFGAELAEGSRDKIHEGICFEEIN